MILDIGSNTGRGGHIIKAAFKNCKLYGVELVKERIELTPSHIYEHIYNESINDCNFLNLKFDYIIAGEVIEHIPEVDFALMLKKCKEILKAMGIPVIEAPEESDSQCASLTINNNVYGVGSEDMDHLTFGSKKLLRNISSSKKNEIIEYDLDKILEELKYTEEQFIDLCILLGCDYVEHIDGIGVKKAKEIIDEFKSIEKFLEKSLDIINEKYIISSNYLDKVKSARSYFLTAPSIDLLNSQLKLNLPNERKIKDLLINKYSYSKTKVEKIISKLINA
jgi:flap endonuclease-1